VTDFLTPQMTVIALALLAFLAVGGLVYAIFFNRVRGSSNAEKRRAAIAERSGDGARVVAAADSAARRRRSVQESLKEMEAKEKSKASQRKSPPLSLRIQQAGLTWSKSTFWLFGAGAGAVFFALGLYLGAPLLACAGFAVAGVLGFPYWFVNFRRKRRFKKFIAEFPNSVDVIVRGVKAGLPLNDCLRIIGAESQEPVRTEFRMIAERQTMGLTTSEAINGLTDRVPLPEANFFAIAITIQQQAGGNLSEALGNLSKVLRERAKMRGKIKAMSTEAKASAWIIGSLPIVVMFLVYMTNPEYIMLLFTEQVGNIILLASAFWMSIGVFVMKRMINFEI